MASHNAMSDYESTLKILSVLECSKPTALVTISQSTGIKLADIIRFCTLLIKANVIKRDVDSGTIYYTLLSEEYEAKVASLFDAPLQEDGAAVEKRPRDSREAIMLRRAMRASGAHEKINEGNAKYASIHDKTPKATPERLSAYDLYAMKRPSPSISRSPDLSQSSQQLRSVRSSAMNPAQSRDDNRRLSSSTTHKAVYINKPSSSRSDSRSSFNIIPPAFIDSDGIERSDGVFKQTNPSARRAQVPLIPEHALATSNNDIPEAEVRDTLQLRSDAPLIAILSPRPCHDIWSACSALANTSGGYIVLGLRKYEKNNEISYFAKSVQNPEDAIKNILKAFNDRDVISDCPQDPSFITSSQIRNKNVIVINIVSSQFAPAPLYTTRDSFGMKTNQGCYLYIDGKIVHCTQEDVKNLWQQKRLGADVPDWSQTSPQASVEMQRKVTMHMPTIVDGAVHPLSRKAGAYGAPVEQCKYEKRTTSFKRSPEDMYEGERLLAMGLLKPAQSPNNAESQATAESRPASSSAQTAAHQTSLFDSLGSDAHKSTVQDLLFAEDFTIPSPSHITIEKDTIAQAENKADASDKKTTTPAKKRAATRAKTTAQQTTRHIARPTPRTHASDDPPLFENADQSILSELAQPVVIHPRLPMTRVCEIAKQLCTHAQFTMHELAGILNKKPAVIKDKVLPKLRENQDFVEENGVFYIRC